MKNPRLAMVGVGAVAVESHIPALKKIGWQPTLLVDPDEARVAPLARKLGASFARDYRSVLSDFDAAIVSVPHNLHGVIGTDLLSNGKSVLMEKPLAMTGEECDRLIAIADEKGVVLGTGLFRRYLKGFGWLAAFLAGGGLGRIKHFDMREGFVYAWPVATDSFWNRTKSGGGVLMDTGAHALDLLVWWFGDVAELSYRDDNFGGVEAECILDVKMKSGATGVVEFSRSHTLRNSCIIEGERGRIEVSMHFNTLTAEPAELLQVRHLGITGAKPPSQTHPGLFIEQDREFLNAVLGKPHHLVSGRDGAGAVKLIERCYAQRTAWDLPWARPPALQLAD